MMPNQQAPAATPAPLHDIAGPLWFFPYPLWTVAVAAVALLLLIGLIVWVIRRTRKPRPPTPRERALAALADLRREGVEADPYSFGVWVSDALRNYIHDQYGLDAVNRTSLEFLESLRGNAVFGENEKAALAEFLEAADLLKYARQSAGSEEIFTLLDIADRLVRAEQPEGAGVS